MHPTPIHRRGDPAGRPPPPTEPGDARRPRTRGQLYRFARILTLLALLLAIAIPAPSTGAQRPNGAGVVIRHGDGTLIYAYVQFEEESITGEELLARTGIDTAFAPFGGLGAGVCRIQDEGCPADDCYCQSYTTPAFFWHYYTYESGSWVEAPFGATSREVRDGDIDGWSWTSGDHGLPPVTIEEIAAINGIDRNPPTPTEPPPATATPTPTPVPPSATPMPEPLPTITATLEPEATSTPEATPEPSTTSTLDPTAATVAPATSTATATPAPTDEEVSQLASSPTSPSTATAQPTSRAVLIRPSATPEVLEIEEDGEGSGNLVMFGALAAGVVIAGAGAVLYRRKTGQ